MVTQAISIIEKPRLERRQEVMLIRPHRPLGIENAPRERMAPVWSFSANAWGLYETVGNVWEWSCSLPAKAQLGSPCVVDLDQLSRRCYRGLDGRKARFWVIRIFVSEPIADFTPA